MGNREDGSIGIGVDGDDLLGFGHTCTVLDGTGDTGADIKAGTDGNTGLTDLIIVADPSGVDSGTGSTDFAAEGFCEVTDEFEVFFGADTVSAGDDDLGTFEVDFFVLTYAFDDFDDGVSVGEFGFDADEFAFAGGIGSVHFHNAFTDCNHLGIVPCVDDSGDDVAAESGTDLHEFVSVTLFVDFVFKVVDLQICAVCGKTCQFFGSDAGSEFTALHGCTEKEDIGMMSLDHIHDDFGVWQNGEGFEAFIFDEINGIATVRIEGIDTFFNAVSEEESFGFDAEFLSEFTAFANEFEADVSDFAAFLFDKDPDISDFVIHSDYPKV